ncbi:MAG: hypothetical protein ISR62_06775 [Desulfobacteraceae bacterium]|nr:hypothetical protein [Desulfobacteraceae bacterium]
MSRGAGCWILVQFLAPCASRLEPSTLDTGYWILDTGCWMLDALDTGYWFSFLRLVPHALSLQHWMLDTG